MKIIRLCIVFLLVIAVLDILPTRVISDNTDKKDSDNDGLFETEGDENEMEEGIPEEPDEETETKDEDRYHPNGTAGDKEWVKAAVRDIAYCLRAHKFNDYDRRLTRDDNAANRVSALAPLRHTNLRPCVLT
jgi:hypothetical protein